jgi:hypothetical protein
MSDLIKADTSIVTNNDALMSVSNKLFEVKQGLLAIQPGVVKELQLMTSKLEGYALLNIANVPGIPEIIPLVNKTVNRTWDYHYKIVTISFKGQFISHCDLKGSGYVNLLAQGTKNIILLDDKIVHRDVVRNKINEDERAQLEVLIENYKSCALGARAVFNEFELNFKDKFNYNNILLYLDTKSNLGGSSVLYNDFSNSLLITVNGRRVPNNHHAGIKEGDIIKIGDIPLLYYFHSNKTDLSKIMETAAEQYIKIRDLERLDFDNIKEFLCQSVDSGKYIITTQKGMARIYRIDKQNTDSIVVGLNYNHESDVRTDPNIQPFFFGNYQYYSAGTDVVLPYRNKEGKLYHDELSFISFPDWGALNHMKFNGDPNYTETYDYFKKVHELVRTHSENKGIGIVNGYPLLRIYIKDENSYLINDSGLSDLLITHNYETVPEMAKVPLKNGDMFTIMDKTTFMYVDANEQKKLSNEKALTKA